MNNKAKKKNRVSRLVPAFSMLLNGIVQGLDPNCAIKAQKLF